MSADIHGQNARGSTRIGPETPLPGIYKKPPPPRSAMITLHDINGQAFYLVAGSFHIESFGEHGCDMGGEQPAWSTVSWGSSSFAYAIETNEQILAMLRKAGVVIL